MKNPQRKAATYRQRRRLHTERLEPRLALSANVPTVQDTLPLDDFQVTVNDNTFANAAELGFVQDTLTVADNVGRRDRNDFIEFVVGQDATLDITLSGLSGDVDIDLYDGRRRRIDRSYTRGNDNESISATVDAGEYYVRVRSRPGVDSNYQLTVDVTLASLPNQFEFVDDFGTTRDWNLNSINAPEVWNAGFTGDGVTIAIVDSGVDWQHSDLAGNIWQNPGEIAGDGIDNDNNGFIDDIHGWDFVQDDANPSDGGDHGTHVAGIVAAARNGVGSTGVAYNAEIIPVRVIESDSGFFSDVARGIRYAVDNGADVINLSLGGGYNSQVYSALQHAESNDVLVVAASGNSGLSRPGFPARHSMQLTNVLSVGSYTSANEMSSFSNGAIGVRDVQVDAPGSFVLSTVPGNDYGFKSGTSMAAPHAAGIAALALSANPELSAAQVRDLIVLGASEYIIGRWPSGGVNASISVFEALEMSGSAPSARVTSGATAMTVVSDEQLVTNAATAQETTNTEITRRLERGPAKTLQNPTQTVTLQAAAHQRFTSQPAREYDANRSRPLDASVVAEESESLVEKVFANWELDANGLV